MTTSTAAVNKSQLFKNAWTIAKSTGIKFGNALRSAWAQIKTTAMTITEKVKANIGKIASEFSYSEKFKKSFHQKKTQLWEKEDKVRLYVARDAYEQAGWIDLTTGELHPSRPGNQGELVKVLNYINNL